ncbi:MAG: pyridoxal phosphate-dependent aminotransferase, partial [Treponemataceae bacterium]|nr:pyridoxal phosphate-dependent aminotransferase [Treponemataceae bacterium]
FYLFCKAPEPKLPENKLKEGQTLDGAFCDHLKKYCILAVPGKGFGKQDYFRLAYCVSFDSIVNSKEPFAKAMAEW